MAPDLRVGDAERDAALAALGEHFAVGRLSREEYDERAEAVWTARTQADLAILFTDLPDGSGGSRTRDRVPPRTARLRFPPVPFVPVLIALVALTAVTRVPFVLIGIVLWVLIPRRHRWPRHPVGHAIGSRRPAGGSWA